MFNLKLAPALAFFHAFLALFLARSLMAETLVIYNWAEYLSQETITNFEARTGNKIRQVYYDNEGDRDRVFLSRHRNEYDLIIFDRHSIALFADNDLLKDLSSLPLSNLNHHGERFREACGPVGIPYGWGTTGIAYRQSVIKEEITSWRSLFIPPQTAFGTVIMPLDEVDTTASLLLALGKPIDSDKLEDMQAAMALLEEQIPYLLKYGYGITHAELRGSESKMAMTMAYSSDIEVLSSLTKQDDWKYVVPDEGGALWVDCWAIPADKPVSNAAIEFLNYLNEPEVAAQNAEEAGFSSTNVAAKPYFSDEYLNNTVLNPEPEVLARTPKFPVLNAEALRLRNWLVFSAKKSAESQK